MGEEWVDMRILFHDVQAASDDLRSREGLNISYREECFNYSVASVEQTRIPYIIHT